jgi:hypothetical protein
MLKFSQYTISMMLVSSALTVLTMAGSSGCADRAPNAEAGETAVHDVAEAQQQVITAETIAGLKPDERLVVQLGTAGAVYTFDASSAPIDFSRITLRAADGAEKPMDESLRGARERGHDVLATKDRRFRLTSTPQGFVELSAADVRTLQETGELRTKHSTPSEQGVGGIGSASPDREVSAAELVCHEEPVICHHCYERNGQWECYEYTCSMTVCDDVEP